MYGMVNKAVQDLVTGRFGAPAWEAIRGKAGVEVGAFVAMSPYPDELTYRLVGAASEVLGLPAAAILEAFGEYWMEYSAQEGYGEMLRLVGKDFPGFLGNLDRLHARLSLSFPELRPPSIAVSDLTADTLRLHYVSERPGLAPFVVGLLKGVGRRFGLAVTATLDRAKADGHDHDEFIVRFVPAGV